MSLLLFKIIAALFIFGVSLLVGLGPLRSARHRHREHHSFELGEALAGGVFLGIALFHMLPDAAASFHSLYGIDSYPYANLLCALGFILLLFLEKIVLGAEQVPGDQNLSAVPYVLPLVLSVHALIEGTALGINTLLTNIIIIFVAIIAHKGSEGFALAANLARSGMSFKRALAFFMIWAAMSPLGIILGSEWIKHAHTQLLAATFNAFAAGTFLYIATLHQATHLCTNRKSRHLYEFLLMLLGLAIMAAVEVWL